MDLILIKHVFPLSSHLSNPLRNFLLNGSFLDHWIWSNGRSSLYDFVLGYVRLVKALISSISIICLVGTSSSELGLELISQSPSKNFVSLRKVPPTYSLMILAMVFHFLSLLSSLRFFFEISPLRFFLCWGSTISRYSRDNLSVWMAYFLWCIFL